MRYLFVLLSSLCFLYSTAQNSIADSTVKDSLLIIGKNPAKGFYHDYILFIPKKTLLNKTSVLLVEPNNTGKLSDSIEVHTQAAIQLASVNSVGNNIAKQLHIPLLVPVFPRLESQPLVYTHALDRDIMLEDSTELKRLDLQLLSMIKDARIILEKMQIPTAEKIFMNGFSASGTFTNRFSFFHPEKIKALAIGGFNGELILPLQKINKVAINYPIGIHDFKKITGKKFDIQTYRNIPQFIYMGKLDDNDAVQYDDAYNEEERNIINRHIASNVQERFIKCQEIYQLHKIQPIFKTYEAIGHWTTRQINLEVISFFREQVKN